jgi:para-aminobenzoate synthetase/4-amino-4-deoxychorismate lyase
MSAPSLPLNPDCFALLDDRDADGNAPRSRLYTGYVDKLTCVDAAALPTMLAQMQTRLAQGLHAVALLTYELGAELHRISPWQGDAPVSQILLFSHCALLSEFEVSAWLDGHCDAAHLAGIVDAQANVTQPQFTDAIDRVRVYIAAGDTYQVNYTYRLRFNAYGSPFDLYRRLRLRQPVPYGALIALPDGQTVLSYSPELFVRHEAGSLRARPMKGTAAASGDETIDAERARALAADPKNRAENLMIVDLLRNDLGRIAEVGSVRVPKLFEVTRFSSVLQMTSTVQAQLRDGVDIADIFDALYPCGSITGAPKRRTMQIIRELEAAPRGYYTGAIGWFDAPNTECAVGDFCLSVPIRTLVLQAPDADGMRRGEMGVGAGIVYDSEANDEYRECQLKASFLTGLRHAFQLFETMHATREHGCRNWARHCARLRHSAQFFGIAFDDAKIAAAIDEACSQMPTGVAHRLRLALDADGNCSTQFAALLPLQEPVKLMLAAQPVHVDPLFLQHKTTVRTEYDNAWRAAEAAGAFDTLFCNARNEVTEGGRSNVFVKLDGRWYTPPLACGVLPGVMRAAMLDDPQWMASERVLTLDDLRKAEQVIVCNALRGALAAEIVW